MKALLYGVKPDPAPEPETDNRLLRNLAHTPMKLVDMDEPGFLLPDWVVTKPRLTGICGSDSKQVFMDWGEVRSPDNPMKAFFSLPQVLGHEVVADVVALGPEAEGLEIGDRVVLNPWLSCGPRGVTPLCPACEVGDFSLCYSFDVGPIAPGIHIGTVEATATAATRELMPAHDSQLFKVPDNVPDELAVFADPFAVSLHSITRHPPTPGGKVMVYGAGALGTCATAILRALYPDVEVLVVARFEAQADDGAQARRDGDRAHARAAGDRGSGRVVGRRAAATSDGLPMAFPGCIDVVYDTVGKQETFEVGDARAEGARHAREGRRARTDVVGGHAAVLQGDLDGRLERVRVRGGRRRAQARHRPLPRPRVERAGSTSPACSPTRSRSTTGATRSPRSPRRTTPARSRSRSTSGS